MKNVNPTSIEGILLIVGAFRFHGELIGIALLVVGSIVLLRELFPLKRISQS